MTTRQIIHGRATSYKRQGCRCDACRDAKRAEDRARYQRSYAQPLPAADEAANLIRALHEHGHSDLSIAEATGVSARTLYRIRIGEYARVTLHTLDALERHALHEGIYP